MTFALKYLLREIRETIASRLDLLPIPNPIRLYWRIVYISYILYFIVGSQGNKDGIDYIEWKYRPWNNFYELTPPWVMFH